MHTCVLLAQRRGRHRWLASGSTAQTLRAALERADAEPLSVLSQPLQQAGWPVVAREVPRRAAHDAAHRGENEDAAGNAVAQPRMSALASMFRAAGCAATAPPSAAESDRADKRVPIGNRGVARRHVSAVQRSPPPPPQVPTHESEVPREMRSEHHRIDVQRHTGTAQQSRHGTTRGAAVPRPLRISAQQLEVATVVWVHVQRARHARGRQGSNGRARDDVELAIPPQLRRFQCHVFVGQEAVEQAREVGDGDAVFPDATHIGAAVPPPDPQPTIVTPSAPNAATRDG